MGAVVSDIDFLLSRAADRSEFERWLERARSTGWCEHPVRLTGSTRQIDRTTGEIVTTFSGDDEPGGHLLKACGTRRATICGPCSRVYRSDAWQLIAAGLRGGKGVPADVAAHPLLFVTLTAPSFGAVHSRRSEAGAARPCHPDAGDTCPHDRPVACTVTHVVGDECTGQALCPDCFDYVGAVLWNAHATELWRRTLIGIERRLAHSLGVPASALRDHARVSYAKVVEYQLRGLVHLHLVIRLDGPLAPSDPPPPGLDASVLEVAVLSAAQRAQCPLPPTGQAEDMARWGEQINLRRIVLGAVEPEVVAAYISKYATKSTDPLGRLDRRLHASELPHLTVGPHLTEFVRTAWRLGGRPELEHLGLRRWAHTLGFRGHWLTKSRYYSTTLGALRVARAAWRAENDEGPPEGDQVTSLKDWRYAGRGWDSPGDAWLARTAAEEAAEAKRLSREARQQDRSVGE